MSLFPAYSKISKETNSEIEQNGEWLKNNSFSIPLPSKQEEEKEKKTSKGKDIEVLQHTSRIKEKEKEKHNKKRSKKKKKKLSPDKDSDSVIYRENSSFYIDKERQLLYNEKTLPKSVRPKYDTPLCPGLFPVYYFKVKQKSKRYFKHFDSTQGYKESTLEEESLITQKVKEFNEKLNIDSHDISTWIEYIKFQDVFYKQQHFKYKSAIERERAIAQHKLSILDKAVEKNPDNKELQALWLKIGTNVLPSEEMSKRIDEILEESGGTMTLWLGLMTTTQYSLARCTVPAITKLYEKLLLNFQNVKLQDIFSRDFNVLELLFHYGRFLDNCGQWEYLWTIIKINLQFNIQIQLNIEIDVDEKVKQLEDEVLKEEKRAVWQLWSQLERIREGLHFLPNSNSVDYPQRSVVLENVINFTWHFHPNLHFQLIVTSIILLKVPLLPPTHTALKFLAPNSLPWLFDLPEFILSSVLISPAVALQFIYLSPITHLSRGPQYLRKIYGQEEFLDLISKTFEACIECLTGRQKTALGVWRLRFERWLHLLNELNLACLPSGRNAKKIFMDFLASEENRNNLLFYTEYCLLLYNQGNKNACIKALTTLISSNPPVLSVDDKEKRETLLAVYKVFCEVLIGSNKKKEALELLINLGNNSLPNSPVTIHSLASAQKKFETLSSELVQELKTNTNCYVEDLLMPNFIVDWISCYLWLMALTKPPVEFRNRFMKFLDDLQDYCGLLAEQIRECLWETMILIMWTLERNNLLVIKNNLQKCHELHPQNLKILSFMAENNLEQNGLWLTLKKTFLNSSSTFGYVFLVCVALHRFYKCKENYDYRMKNLFQDLALKEGKISFIIHSLRLRFLYQHENASLDVAQLQALESCPWHKSIYMESILLLPAKLMQLTDVLVEKELKIHITPDEIQVLRD